MAAPLPERESRGGSPSERRGRWEQRAGVAGQALVADAAEHGETGNDVVAGPEVGHQLAHLLHYAGGLVAQYGGRCHGVQPLHEVEIAVADAAGDGADHDLPCHWPVYVHLFNCQGRVDGMKDGGFHSAPPVLNR